MIVYPLVLTLMISFGPPRLILLAYLQWCDESPAEGFGRLIEGQTKTYRPLLSYRRVRS